MSWKKQGESLRKLGKTNAFDGLKAKNDANIRATKNQFDKGTVSLRNKMNKAFR